MWIVPWEREGVDPSPGPAPEPAYTALWSRKWMEGVCCHFSATALEALPCSFHSPKGSRNLPGVSPLGFTLLASLPTVLCRPGICVAAATDTESQMKEFLFLLRVWGSGRICTEKGWNSVYGPGTLDPSYSGATTTMVSVPPKTFHSPHNIKVPSGPLSHCPLPPNLTHLSPPMGGTSRCWLFEIHLPWGS